MENVEKMVKAILEEVQKDGDKALLKFTRVFDGFSLTSKTLRIPEEVIEESLNRVSVEFKQAVLKVKKNIEVFQRRVLPKSWTITRGGVTLGEKYSPVESAGLYIPGGKFPYPSTVLMTAVPAQVAGVKRIAMVTPPGNVTNDVLATAAMCGITEIYSIGGAQAIAALAYGTETIPKVDMIVGPGNSYVAMAKKLVFGTVGIDSIAGPSEVIIIADDSVRSEYVVSDLMAQAEHASGSEAMLLTSSKKLADLVKTKIGKFPNVKIQVLKTMDEIIALTNARAPEHVELLTRDARTLSKKITQAGAIFIGHYSPTAVGDYFAGPSHVLPTGGTARFSSGLSSADFMKHSSIIEYTQKALGKAAQSIIALAEREGLKFHASSVIQRGKK
ncbi:MAG: histidinol dehydrogenase [bacterium]|nr:histidinol dehydrogenase [bacterium]